MKKLIYLLILAAFLSACSKGKVLGTVNGSTVTSSEFYDMLIDKYGFSKKRNIPENRLQKIFNDYYTYHALVKAGEEKNYFANEEIKQLVKIAKIRMQKSDLSSILWVKDIKPKVIPISKHSLRDKDFQPYMVTAKARYILFDTKKRSKAQIKAAIKQIREAIAKKVPFEKFVKQYSDDIKTNQKGGLVDWFDMSYMGINAEVKKAILFSGVPGFLVGPIETNEGIYLVHMEGKKSRTLKEVKSDKRIVSFLKKQLRTPVCKRKDSKDTSKTYMTKLRKKYKDKVNYHPETLKKYFIALNRYCITKHRPVYNEFLKSKYSKIAANNTEKMTQLQRYLDKYHPLILNDFNKAQGKMVFLKVDGASIMTVADILKTMRGQAAKFIADRKALNENVRKRFIDYDLRYLECVRKGYEKDERLVKKALYNEVEIKGKIYKKHLLTQQRKKLESRVTDKMVKDYYEKRIAKYNRKPYANIKGMVKGKLVNRKLKRFERKMIRRLLKKYQIKLNR